MIISLKTPVRLPGGRAPSVAAVRGLLIGLFLGWATVAFGQIEGLRVTAAYQDRPLAEVLAQLTVSHALRFSYLDETVADLRVNCSFREATWEEVAGCLLVPNGIEAEVLANGQIVLRTDGLQPVSVCLEVVNPAGEPLPFVTLGNTRRGVSLATNADGILRTTLRLGKRDSLDVHYLGYGSRTIDPRKFTDTAYCHPLILAPASIELTAVTVTEYLAPGVSATSDGRRVILDPGVVDGTPGFADREVFRELARLPGINSLGESAGRLSIRGGTPDQHLVLWDNIPVYSSGHYLGMISNFSTDLIDAVDVWRGRTEAEFGGHVSGVIRMRTDRDVARRFSAGAGLSLLQLQGHVKAPLLRDRSDLQASFSGSLPALLTGPAYTSYRSQALQGYRVGESESTVEDFRFGEWNGRWRLTVGKGHTFTLSGFRQTDDITYLINSTNGFARFTDELQSINTGGALHYAFEGSRGARTDAWLTHTEFSNEGENAFRNRTSDVGATRSSAITETSFKAMHTLGQPTKGLRWQFGMQGQRFDHDFSLTSSNFQTGRLREITLRAGDATVLAPYASYGLRKEGLELQLGLRTPWYEATRRVYFEPRLSGSYRLGRDWLVKAGLGFNHQFPLQLLDLSEGRVSQSAPLWTLADDANFPVPAGREISAGVSGNPGPWLLDVEFYHKRVNDLSATILSLEDAGLATGSSLARGMDLLLRRRYGPWRTGIVYSLSRTTWNFPTLAAAPFPADLDRPHRLEVEQAYRNGPWELAALWQLQSAAPYTPATVGPPRMQGGNITADLVYGVPNSLRLTTYQRLDLSAAYTWPTERHAKLGGTVTLSLLNLTDRTNVLERTFSLALRDTPAPGERRLFPESFDRLGLGFTPNLSIRLNWR